MDRIERLLAEREKAETELKAEDKGSIGYKVALLRYRDALLALTLALAAMLDG